MVTITLHCPHCQSAALLRNGHVPNGKQLYRCRACGRQSRENPAPNVYPEARREILHASSRTQQFAWSHVHGSRVSRTTVSSWIKKKSTTSAFVDHPAHPGP
jgi:transposase-like protein